MGRDVLKHLAQIREEHPEIQEEYERQKPHWDAIQALVRARNAAGVSQAELARRMHVSRAVVSRLESGAHPPRIDTLAKAGNAIGCELSVTFKKRKTARAR